MPKERRHVPERTYRAVCFGVMVWLSGCYQNIYDARTLPPEYMAHPAVDVQSLDLLPLAQTQATSNMVQVGDVLSVAVISGAVDERSEERWLLRVAPEGTLNVPLVGTVPVAGLDLLDVEQAIGQACVQRGVFRRPAVSVTMDTRRTNRVTVMGAVEKPDTYDLPTTSSDLLSALVAAGGLAERADRIVEIQPALPPGAAVDLGGLGANVPGQPRASFASYSPYAGASVRRVPISVDLVTASSGKDRRGYPLEDGSVVTVRSKPTEYIHVIGLVLRPDQFELPANKELRMLDAIALANGPSVPLANKVYVVRRPPGAPESIVIKSSIRSAKRDARANVLLAPGDVVSVEETPGTFTFVLLRQFFHLGVGVSGRAVF
jgi:polysaccharide export outer membrane protein